MDFPAAALTQDIAATKGGKTVRLYGIALGLTRCGRIRVLLADGRIVYRLPENVTTYPVWPSNWAELYQKGEVIFRRKPMMD